jgi:hypothetical protein
MDAPTVPQNLFARRSHCERAGMKSIHSWATKAQAGLPARSIS